MSMESNESPPMARENLSALGIIKEAIIVYNNKAKFIIYTSLTSLPLFIFLVYFETIFLNFLIKVSHIVPHENTIQLEINTFEIARKLDWKFACELIRLCSLYLIPLPLIELGTVISIVGPASKIYNQGKDNATLEGFIKISSHAKKGLRGVLDTFVYAFLLSTFTLLGLIWIVMLYFVVLRYHSYSFVFAIVCGMVFGFVLKIYLEWNAIWLMSVVISILEGVYGFEGIGFSCYFQRGNESRGLVVMLVFFVYGVILRLPCIFFGCFETELWIFAQIGLFCLGNVVKWIVVVVYFHDCKNRVFEKKFGSGIV